MHTESQQADNTHSHHEKKMLLLVVGALGVVFGDIGTSPLYAVRESFHTFNLPTDSLHVYGLMSLIFWLLTLIVSVKYISFIMRADNRGEGGNLALLALAKRLTRDMPGLRSILVILGIIGGSLFFADAAITPAISVMSAIEGLKVMQPDLERFVTPLACIVLMFLFAGQSQGTGLIGRFFGPVMVLWFTVLAGLGLASIVQTPQILMAISPHHAWLFFVQHPLLSFWTLGAAVLAVTGAEALYADMGHFSRNAISTAWFYMAGPALVLNYFGQGALLLRSPEAIENPFYLLAPSWALMPMVVLATIATIIASQSVISGTYTAARQAMLLGYLPRMRVMHTSAHTKGQVYIPTVNWLLCATVIVIVAIFQTSSALAAAYGLAITGVMLITTILFMIVARLKWKWSAWALVGFGGVFVTLELALLGANMIKLLHGAWLPVTITAVLYILGATWAKGQKLLQDQMKKNTVPPESYVSLLNRNDYAQINGTGFYLTRQRGMIPPSFLLQLRHTKVLQDQVVFLTAQIMETPTVPKAERCEYRAYGKGFHRIILHYGFKEEPNLQRDLPLAREQGFEFNWADSSFFIASESIIPIKGNGMPLWQDWVFMMMKRNAGDVISYLKLPHENVVELKSQHVV